MLQNAFIDQTKSRNSQHVHKNTNHIPIPNSPYKVLALVYIRITIDWPSKHPVRHTENVPAKAYRDKFRFVHFISNPRILHRIIYWVILHESYGHGRMIAGI